MKDAEPEGIRKEKEKRCPICKGEKKCWSGGRRGERVGPKREIYETGGGIFLYSVFLVKSSPLAVTKLPSCCHVRRYHVLLERKLGAFLYV
jgi:hypothetical protein